MGKRGERVYGVSQYYHAWEETPFPRLVRAAEMNVVHWTEMCPDVVYETDRSHWNPGNRIGDWCLITFSYRGKPIQIGLTWDRTCDRYRIVLDCPIIYLLSDKNEKRNKPVHSKYLGTAVETLQEMIIESRKLIDIQTNKQGEVERETKRMMEKNQQIADSFQVQTQLLKQPYNDGTVQDTYSFKMGNKLFALHFKLANNIQKSRAGVEENEEVFYVYSITGVATKEEIDTLGKQLFGTPLAIAARLKGE